MPGPEQPLLDDVTVRDVEPYLMAFARRAVREEAAAKDVVQQTYVAVLEGKARFEGRSQLRTWLVGILSRKIMDYFRRGKRESLTGETDDHASADIPTSYRFGVERKLDDDRAMAVIDASLAHLPRLERMAVMLCDVEGVERDTAAATLEVTTSHLRVLLHRGRNKLRRALEDADLQANPA